MPWRDISPGRFGLTRIDQLRKRPDVIDFVRNAMVIESGRALIAQYGGVDPIFTPAGFAGYAGKT
jgi:hypothetical protein